MKIELAWRELDQLEQEGALYGFTHELEPRIKSQREIIASEDDKLGRYVRAANRNL